MSFIKQVQLYDFIYYSGMWGCMENIVHPDQLASEEASFSGSKLDLYWFQKTL